MPFFSSKQCTEPAQAALKVLGDKTFQITSSFWYRIPAGFTKKYLPDSPLIEVRAHQGKATTDLASVPSFLWGVLASYGPHLMPALLHDQRCEDVRIAKKAGEGNPFLLRSKADYEFRKALAEAGVGRVRRRVFWAGVAFGKYLSYGRGRGLLLAPHVVIGMAAQVGLLLSLFGVRWMDREPRDFAVVLGLALLASAAWWRDWSLPFVAILAGPLLVSLIVFTYVVTIIVFFTDGAEQAPATIRKLWTALAAKLTARKAPAVEPAA
ncbi:hypothetical protein GCM10011609_08910 [Lentzea pudingi]|uniref:DUF1353 domain-containing protein n=1 Tax=Lentzea pudingi TaxID=1789439 RepID=A0ABQ2HC35_9PSEU|nr:DUF1353 domain-containing protein [Lentzea pudingi]GGM75184.1 hypothetical protein GCM10011609_08910 [Lentzea pudingi]